MTRDLESTGFGEPDSDWFVVNPGDQIVSCNTAHILEHQRKLDQTDFDVDPRKKIGGPDFRRYKKSKLRRFFKYLLIFTLITPPVSVISWPIYDVYTSLNDEICTCLKPPGPLEPVKQYIDVFSDKSNTKAKDDFQVKQWEPIWWHEEKDFDTIFRHLNCTLLKVWNLVFSVVDNYDPKLISKAVNFRRDNIYNTVIYDTHWEIIAKINWSQYREYASLDEIPEFVKDIFIWTEDAYFYHHPWINLISIIRAAIANNDAWKIVQWWSTINQQLAKLLIIWSREKSYSRKILDILYALKMEEILSKDEILETWLNVTYYWNWIYWIKNASQFYFWKLIKDLSFLEATTLVWILQSPNNLDPKNNLEASTKRRNVILTLLKKKWVIETYTDLDKYMKEPIIVVWEDLKVNKAPYAVDYISKVFWNKTWKTIKRCKCEVHTTIDLGATEKAREALEVWYIEIHKDRYEKLKAKLGKLEKWTAYYNRVNIKYLDAKKRYNEVKKVNWWVLVTNPHSWEIRAVIWWMDYDKNQYNTAIDARRQVWSIMKLFNTLAALVNWISPNRGFYDSPVTLRTKDWKAWRPKNWWWKMSRHMLNMREILIDSVNIPTVRMMAQIWFPKYFETLESFWIKVPWKHISISLWSLKMSLFELSELVSIVSNWWNRVSLKIIDKIVNKNWFETNYPSAGVEKVIDEKYANLVKDWLVEVVNSWTWRVVKKDWVTFYWKTWTTNYNVDVWFVWAGKLSELWYWEDTQLVVWLWNNNWHWIYKRVVGWNTAASVFRYYFKLVLDEKEWNAKVEIWTVE